MAGDYPSTDFVISEQGEVQRVVHFTTGIEIVTILLAGDPVAQMSFPLKLKFGAQAFGIAPDRRDGKDPASATIGHPAILGVDPPIDLDRVPLFGMADIEDRGVVMYAPEERH